ncbi:MAG TPA: class I SAM-dependent methyltransferase [Pyrinomonadaceae bacterium]|nr:class I SAM-dependent methyltransferase [Pyrinomonadaceae bacterium]
MRSESVKGSAEACTSDVRDDPVCEFYTSNPYPPPIEDLDHARDMYRDENVRRAEYHLMWPHKKYCEDLDVLVAGCGTWQSAKEAISHPGARVVGIDVSPTSLEHTEKLKRKYDLTHLETRQLPVENIGELDQSFDLIICTGVLHHLVDPDAGLRALRSVLKPEGAMFLMVYAPYGRAGVYMIREYCNRLGIGTSQQEINDLTSVLKEMPAHNLLLSTLRGSMDSLTADFLVDAVMNPRDKAYSVPQLFDFIERNDLKFDRWYWQAPYLPQCGAIATTAHADRLTRLPEREQYTLMELWRGLMTNHYVLVQRDGGLEVRFDDERYFRYVPIRRSWTVVIGQGLPDGVAAALLNQTHPFEDLILFIDAQEKRMFEAIDGRRSISEIVDKVKEEGPSPLLKQRQAPRAYGRDVSLHAREFFEKLWLYDQVVFDTSKAQ